MKNAPVSEAHRELLLGLIGYGGDDQRPEWTERDAQTLANFCAQAVEAAVKEALAAHEKSAIEAFNIWKGSR